MGAPFRDRWTSTLPAIRWPLLGVGAVAVAWALTVGGDEQPATQVEVRRVPDRLVELAHP